MDWVTVLVRFALYLDLMLVFGLPLFHLHALRKPERSSVLARKLSTLTVSAAIVGMLLSTISMVLMTKAMSGAADFSSIEQHMFEMMLTDTPFGLAWCLRMTMLGAVCLGRIVFSTSANLEIRHDEPSRRRCLGHAVLGWPWRHG